MAPVLSSSSSKKKKPDSSGAKFKEVSSVGGVPTELYTVSANPVVLSKCYVCGGSDDEDLILVCDNQKGCANEAHMYCLDPVLTSVPEGDWFCDFCDEFGTSKQLSAYFEEFHKTHSIPTKKSFYNLWLDSLQYQYIFVDQLKHSYLSPRFTSDITVDMDLIGCPVSLLISGVDDDIKKSHTGRILMVRANEELGRREHLVHFKSGADGRNKSVFHWMCLDEHACFVRTELVWIRVSSSYSSWTPAQKCCRSALYKARLQYKVDARARIISPSSVASSVLTTSNNNNSSYYYLFGEEEVIEVRKKETVVPFEDKLKQGSLNLAKKQSMCYAFACVELEESQSVLRAYHTMPKETLAVIGATADGVTSADLKALCDLTVSHIATHSSSSAVATGAASHKKYELPFMGDYSRMQSSISAREFRAHALRHGGKPMLDRGLIVSAELPSADPDRQEVLQCLESVLEKIDSEIIADETPKVIPSQDVEDLEVPDHLVNLDLPLLAMDHGLPFPYDRSPSFCLPCLPLKSNTLNHWVKANYEPVDFLDTVNAQYSDFVKAQHAAFLERKAKEKEAREEKKRARVEGAKRARELRQQQQQVQQLKQGAKKVPRRGNLEEEDEEEWNEDQSSLFVLGDMTRRGLRNFLRSGGGGSVPPELLDELLAPDNEGATRTRASRHHSGGTTVVGSSGQPVKKPKKGYAYVDVHSEIADFAAGQESLPQLLSDVDRSSWPGTIVTDLERGAIGRVVYFESGWTVVRTLQGVLKARPYELELVPEGSQEFINFEDAEILLVDSEAVEGHPAGGENNGVRGVEPPSLHSTNSSGQAPLPQLHYALDDDNLLLDFEGMDGSSRQGHEDGFESDEELEYDELYDDAGDAVGGLDDFNVFNKPLPMDSSPEAERKKPTEVILETESGHKISESATAPDPGGASAPSVSTTASAEVTKQRAREKLKPSRIKYIETLPPSIAARIRKKSNLIATEASSASSSSSSSDGKKLEPAKPAVNAGAGGHPPSASLGKSGGSFQFKRWNRYKADSSITDGARASKTIDSSQYVDLTTPVSEQWDTTEDFRRRSGPRQIMSAPALKHQSNDDREAVSRRDSYKAPASAADPRLKKVPSGGARPQATTTTIITEDGEELVVIDRRDEDDDEEDDELRKDYSMDRPATFGQRQAQHVIHENYRDHEMTPVPYGRRNMVHPSRPSSIYRTDSTEESSDSEVKRNTNLNRRIDLKRSQGKDGGPSIPSSSHLKYTARTTEGKNVTLYKPASYQQTFPAGNRQFAALDEDFNLFETSQIVSNREGSTDDGSDSSAAVDALLQSVAHTDDTEPMHRRKRPSRFDQGTQDVIDLTYEDHIDRYVSEEEYMNSAGFVSEAQLASLNVMQSANMAGFDSYPTAFNQVDPNFGGMVKKKTRFDEPPANFVNLEQGFGYNASAHFVPEVMTGQYDGLTSMNEPPVFQEFAVVQAMDSLIASQQQQQQQQPLPQQGLAATKTNDDDDDLVSCDGEEELEEGEVDESKPDPEPEPVPLVSVTPLFSVGVPLEAPLLHGEVSYARGNPIMGGEFGLVPQPYFDEGALMMATNVDPVQANLMLEELHRQQQLQLQLQQEQLMLMNDGCGGPMTFTSNSSSSDFGYYHQHSYPQENAGYSDFSNDQYHPQYDHSSSYQSNNNNGNNYFQESGFGVGMLPDGHQDFMQQGMYQNQSYQSYDQQVAQQNQPQSSRRRSRFDCEVPPQTSGRNNSHSYNNSGHHQERYAQNSYNSFNDRQHHQPQLHQQHQVYAQSNQQYYESNSRIHDNDSMYRSNNYSSHGRTNNNNNPRRSRFSR